MICPRALLGRLALAPVVALLVACSPAPAPTPAPPTAAPERVVTAVPPPTATRAPAATVAVSPIPSATATAEEDRRMVEGEGFSIRLPDGWEPVDGAALEARTVADQLGASRPVLAGLAGGTGALEAAELVAIGAGRDGAASSLIVRRSPLGAERLDDLQRQVVDLVLPQYTALGFAPQAGPPDLQTAGGLAVAAIAYTAPPEGDGAAIDGEQYYVATDSDLWILTYSTAGGKAGEHLTFEQSARSFAPR